MGNIISADRSTPLSPDLSGPGATFSHDAAAQMNEATYDKMGRAASQNGHTFVWDLGSRLLSFTASIGTTSLNDDGVGHLASITTGGATREFVTSYATNLCTMAIVRQAGADLRYYVTLPDGTPIASIEASGAQRHFYHFDELGNTQFLTDDSGKVTDTHAITSYGEIATRSGTTDNPFTFQGQFGVYEEAPRLNWIRARHYDAAAARFLSRVP